jgi:hypothetical protein
MSNSEFLKRWFLTNMMVLGAALVANSVIVTWTGRPIHLVVPGFTTNAFAADADEPRHSKR